MFKLKMLCVVLLLVCITNVLSVIPVYSENKPLHARLNAEFMDSWDHANRAERESGIVPHESNEIKENSSLNIFNETSSENDPPRSLFDEGLRCPAGQKRIKGICRPVS